ncbi:MAG: GNAT family N-acetyltransferase [Candidatus Nanopelagicaceae bacterium]
MIRPAVKEDAPIILQLIKELAEYEKAPNEVIATVKDIEATIFAEDPKVFCELVEIDGNVVGMAIWFLNYSTWQGRHGIYLEDLYIKPEFRGKGFGKALLQHLARICSERGYGRFQWWVLDWNSPAIEFYHSIGAVPMSEWTVFRVSGEPLKKLAD